jgi:DNA-binding PadR family transcriptional regulator
MELDSVLLGLISMHKGISGYELNTIMQESTGYLLSASLSHIYPALRRLNERDLVSYQDFPIKNRLSKKIYNITPAGEAVLQKWLRKPVEEDVLDAKPFYLKMAFSPLMDKGTILAHIDREILRLEQYHRTLERDIQKEMDYLDKQTFDRKKAALLWGGINQVTTRTDAMRLAWLKEWRVVVEKEIKD